MAKPRVFRIDEKTELLTFLQSVYPDHKRTRLRQYLRHRCVVVDGEVATRHDHPLEPGNKVRVEVDKKRRPDEYLNAGVKLLFEDDEFLVIHKPAGMLSVPTPTEREGTALHIVNDYLVSGPRRRRFQALVVHRLDRHTSGLLLFAKTVRARAFLIDHWRRVRKTYLAIVEGRPRKESGTLRSYLKDSADMKVRATESPESGAEAAATHYRVVKTNGRFTLVECDLLTGKKNQIRVQLAELGHPVVGDLKYGSKKNPVGRMTLHAWRMTIPHPETEEPVEIESPMPDLFARLVAPSPPPDRGEKP